MFDSFIHAALPFLQIATNSTVPPEAISGLTQQVNSNDTATAIMGFTGVAAGIGAVVKSVFTDKNQKTNRSSIKKPRARYSESSVFSVFQK